MTALRISGGIAVLVFAILAFWRGAFWRGTEVTSTGVRATRHAERPEVTATACALPTPIAARRAVPVPELVPTPEVSVSRIPETLPSNPGVEAMLAERSPGSKDDLRASYSYILGLYASVDRCLGGRHIKGAVGYFIQWQLDPETGERNHPDGIVLDEYEDGLVHASDEDRDAFVACATDYLAAHDVTGNYTMSWAMTTRFPLEENGIVRLARGD